MSRTYTVVVDPDPRRGGHTVTVPALPGVVTQGDTVEQCIERVQEAIALHLARMAEDGESIPEEHEKPLLLTVTVSAWRCAREPGLGWPARRGARYPALGARRQDRHRKRCGCCAASTTGA